jgi:hypothetical protein
MEKYKSSNIKERVMHKYFVCHSFPKGELTHEQICQVSEASQHEDHIRGYRSFFNLSEGKVWCVLEADSPKALADWFKKMNVPFDSIDFVEFEGEYGTITDLTMEPVGVA